MLSSLRAVRLRCEHLTNPLAVDNAEPRLSWVWHADGPVTIPPEMESWVRVTQQVRGVQKVIWESSRRRGGHLGFEDDSTPLSVDYRGPGLKTADRVWWQVGLHLGDGAERWSEPATWTTGVGNWTAQWIGHLGLAPAAEQRLPIFRRRFRLPEHPDKTLVRAMAYTCGLGHFEMRVNGKRSGDAVFEPGWSDYDSTCYYVGHDITEMLQPGANAIGVLLGHGMHHTGGGTRYRKFKRSFGPSRLIMQVHLRFADGSAKKMVTDPRWKSAPGPITYSCIFGGEDTDARLIEAGWDSPGFDDSQWQPAAIAPTPAGTLRAVIAQPIRAQRVFPAVTSTTIQESPDASIRVFDLGQNMAGVPAIELAGHAGAEVIVRPGEVLDAAGRVSQKNIGSPVYYKYGPTGSLDSAPHSWRPRFSYSGFRYLEVQSAGPVRIDRACGIELHADVQTIGTFECSNDLLNRIHTLIDNAVRSNLQAVLTDCPHREKLGWLEQLHLMAPSILCRFDLAAFYHKAAIDMIDAQAADGCVPTIAPEYVRFEGQWADFSNSPEWGAALILGPWHSYRATGDARILQASFPAMRKYMNYLTTRTQRAALLDFGLGDWYDIGPGDPGFSKLTGKRLTASATYFECAKAMEQISEQLLDLELSERYSNRAAQIRQGMNHQLFDPATSLYDRPAGTTHAIEPVSQTAQAMPLALGIVEPAQADAVLARLVQDIENHNYHVTAGDIGFRYVLDALSQAGRDDVIARMLLRTDAPSYGAQLAAGATTLTEAWDANPTKSLNHLMLGHAMGWLHQRLGGLVIDRSDAPGQQIRIDPALVDDVDFASVTRESSLGRVEVAWRKTGPTLAQVDVQLPPGQAAVLRVSGRWKAIHSGRFDVPIVRR